MTLPLPDESPSRDPRFDAVWRCISQEEPDPTLDAAILAAARKEIGAGPRNIARDAARRARNRWWPLAAAATIAVIAIGIAQRAGRDELGAPATGSATVTDIPAPAAMIAAESPKTPSLTDAQRAVPPTQAVPALESAPRREAARASETAPRQELAAREAPARRDTPRSAPASPAALAEKKTESAAGRTLPDPFPAATPAQDATAAANAEPAALPAPGALPAPTAMPPPAAFAGGQRAPEVNAARPAPMAKMAAGSMASDARARERAPLPVADWIALIRRLRDEGRTADTGRELAAFRAAHIDHATLLPSDLRDWKPAER